MLGIGPRELHQQVGQFRFGGGDHFFLLQGWLAVVVDGGVPILRLTDANTEIGVPGGWRYALTHVPLHSVQLSEGDLIYAEEVWPEIGRGGNLSEGADGGDFHLRFQRTLPSLLSSRIIPCSASS